MINLSQRSKGVAFLLIASVLLSSLTARAQLAITEMLSAALKTNGMIVLTNHSDLWELTNFGTNTVDVSRYYFSDNKNDWKRLVKTGNPPLFIRTNESVVFVRNDITENDMQFREWWGSCVGSNVQVRFYGNPGFASSGDGIRVADEYYRVVDSVDFGRATRGVSFTYDANTGVFPVPSVLGEGVTCRAETAADIGSPGATTGPIPLRIVQQPADQQACLGVNVTFEAAAVGMPRPRYQWFFNNSLIANATATSYTVSNITVADAGLYRVAILNGLSVLQSSNAVLSIDTIPSAPVFVAPLLDVTAVTNSTARFAVSICAFPAPTYQWFSNGVAMADATNRTMFVRNCTLDMSGAEFRVDVQNAGGSNSVSARLYVVTKPDLRFTEVQPYPNTACDGHHDWFELTNFGTNAVDLFGYRFSDVSFAGAVSVTKHLVILPNESVVFAKMPKARDFIDWWGADQLPPGLKVYPYSGFSLSKDGDALYLWSADAEDPYEIIARISYSHSDEGVSLQFDYDLFPFGAGSIPGQFGAFRAQECGDIGSPGYTTNPPPRFVSIVSNPAGTNLKWRGVEGANYRIEYSPTPQTNVWNWLGDTTATNALPTMTDDSAPEANQRFYRISYHEH